MFFFIFGRRGRKLWFFVVIGVIFVFFVGSFFKGGVFKIIWILGGGLRVEWREMVYCFFLWVRKFKIFTEMLVFLEG